MESLTPRRRDLEAEVELKVEISVFDYYIKKSRPSEWAGWIVCGKVAIILVQKAINFKNALRTSVEYLWINKAFEKRNLSYILIAILFG